MVDFITSMFLTIITSAAPVSELRGGIPLGIHLGLDPLTVIPLAIVANVLIFFPIYFGLEFLYERVFCKYKLCRKIIGRADRKGRKYVEKYGIWGLLIFVAIPFPLTGAWTGTIIAWIMRLDWKKSFIAVVSGVVIAAVIISSISLGVLSVSPYILEIIS